ncbi:superoxide dismutase family protein [Mycolicibacterium gilvum]|uniref:Cu/Zn superoxide dismutase n=2 Tax=Mycolicibacterium gilvum TaxID=1804 RepID=E6TJZ7_MYCSR|nr:superoxide dismutase family protein [Mycolicibacterium gilvum]ABP44467.1 superoxide dismutase, copper/zinc binding protein [Mycolicibacterium gilvum PYR-GCK]ADT98086.1 Cu/Zn superoxide dismutase [Mycolicibacterium gilvum Spyr1]
MNKHVTAAIALLATPAAILSGCSNQSGEDESSTTTPSSSANAADAQQLKTQLKTVDDKAVAEATIDFTGGFATVTVETVDGATLSPGFHGLHIHAFGRCEPNSPAPDGGPVGDFNSAGDHFQGEGMTGMPAAGDLPPLLVRSDGNGKLVATTDTFTEEQLTGPDGSSILLHEGADMPGAEQGADTRIACGVISPASTETSVSTSTSTSTVTTTVAPAVPPNTASETTPTTPPPTTDSPTPTTTVTTETTAPTETVKTTTTAPVPAPNG